MSTLNEHKKRLGRPPVDSEMVRARMRREALERVDAYRATQRPIPSRPEAIRRLVDIAVETIPIVLEMIAFLESQANDAESLAIADKLRKIVDGQ